MGKHALRGAGRAPQPAKAARPAPARKRPARAPQAAAYKWSICAKDEVEQFAGASVTHLLSLEDPRTPKQTPAWFNGTHLQVQFHDVESPAEARQMSAVAPTRDHVAQILRFGATCLATSRRKPVHLLVHCFAGASRSPAVCYALVAQAYGPGREAEALAHVLGIRPAALPNLLIVKYADELLGRGGRLLRALYALREDVNRMIEEWLGRMSRSLEQ